MKVSTDSLILGSWADPRCCETMLDIGTGSGILSLMLMQRADAQATIEAVDVDPSAVTQATENVQQSPWYERMSVRLADITTWQPTRRFALIIANPPYFAPPLSDTKAYHTQSQPRTLARQTVSLTPAGLMSFAADYLLAAGNLYCLYPTSLSQHVQAAAENAGLYVNRRLNVRHHTARNCYVTAFCIGKEHTPPSTSLLTIRNDAGEYTEQYKTLCQPYYLDF